MAHGAWKDLFKAVEENNFELVSYYLQQGIDINYQHPEYFTNPFFESIRKKNHDLVLLFLQNGARMEEKELFTGLDAFAIAKQVQDESIMALIKKFESK